MKPWKQSKWNKVIAGAVGLLMIWGLLALAFFLDGREVEVEGNVSVIEIEKAKEVYSLTDAVRIFKTLEDRDVSIGLLIGRYGGLRDINEALSRICEDYQIEWVE